MAWVGKRVAGIRSRFGGQQQDFSVRPDNSKDSVMLLPASDSVVQRSVLACLVLLPRDLLLLWRLRLVFGYWDLYMS